MFTPVKCGVFDKIIYIFASNPYEKAGMCRKKIHLFICQGSKSPRGGLSETLFSNSCWMQVSEHEKGMLKMDS